MPTPSAIDSRTSSSAPSRAICRRLRVLVLPLLAASAPAQTPDTATLRGHIEDTSHAAVASAHITATDERTGLTRHAESDDRGRFAIPALPASGAYTVLVTHAGFAEARTARIRLAGGSSAEVALILRAAGESSTVTVTGTAEDLRIDQPQLGIHLGEAALNAIPLPSRRLTFLPLLESANRPAINQGDIFMNQNLFTTNGAGRRQAWFEVDGANSVDLWGRQTIFTNLPLMSVGEMTVLSNSFSAQFGGSTGSVVNIVTRTGGDRLHGQLLELWRPAATEASLAGFTAANAASGNDITSDVLGQTAAALSGPLGSSRRTHFLAAAEFNRQAKASPVTSPLAPGSYVGRYRGWLGSLRLDRQLSDNHTVFLRAALDSFTDTNPNGIVGGASLPSVARIFRRRTFSAELGDTAVLSPHLLNNLRLQFQLASPITQFDPVVNGTQFVVPISSGGTFTSGTSQSALLMNRQYEVSETLALTRGRHQLALGGSVVYAHTGGNSKEFGGPIFLGRFTYNTCTLSAALCQSPAFLNNLANVANFQQSFGNATYTVDDQLWSLFAQDDLRLTRRLTLNLGLRYERQTFTDATRNLAPRLGLVFSPRDDGSLVLRAGFGIYHSQVVDNAFASYALGEPNGVFTYTATPGQVGFPSSVAAAPLPAFPTSAVAPIRNLYVRPGQAAYLNQFFPTAVLKGYPSRLLNPYSEQYTLSLEQRLSPAWVLSLDYVGTHTLRILRPLDIDSPAPFVRSAQNQTRSAQAANCTRPFWISWSAARGAPCTTTNTNPPPYSVIQTDVNNGYLHYNALNVDLKHAFQHRFFALISYTWSHTLDNVDPDTTSQNPNDPNLTQHEEYGPAIYDQRHRLVLSGDLAAPFKIHVGGVSTVSSGLPYNYVTGTTNSGDTGASTDRPVINGVVVGRNAGRGNGIYSVDPFISRSFPIVRESIQLDLRAEAFNVLNHANFVAYSGTYGNGLTPGAGFGAPLPGVTAQLPARQLQFSAHVSF
jgi:hypothetical protein